MSRILTNQEAANAPKSRRQVGKGGILQVRDSNTLIQSRDIVEAEKQRRRWEREAKQKRAEIDRQAAIRDQENQRKAGELEWVNGDDGQPLYCIDRQGMAL
jgi:ribonuclease HI